MKAGFTQPIPTEEAEQEALFKWASFYFNRFPCLELLMHIPNEGKRSISTGAKLKRQGLRKGFPDIFLPVASGKFHGLYIELKRIRNGRVSTDQKWWIDNLNKQGYYASVCCGWEQAAQTILKYLRGEINESGD